MATYHTAIGIPTDCDRMVGRYTLETTDHAEERADNYHYGSFEIPEAFTITPEMYERDPYVATEGETDPHVFEVCTQHGRVVKGRDSRSECASDGDTVERVTKIAVRYPYDSDHDQILVVAEGGVVVTAWLNNHQDAHDTLDEDQYAVPA